MITGIVTVGAGICVMLGTGVALSTALHWMNTFEFDTARRKSPKGRPGGHSRATEGRNRMAGGRGPGAGLDMFE